MANSLASVDLLRAALLNTRSWEIVRASVSPTSSFLTQYHTSITTLRASHWPGKARDPTCPEAADEAAVEVAAEEVVVAGPMCRGIPATNLMRGPRSFSQ